MLTRIVHNSPHLCAFLEQLQLDLSQSQGQHMLNLADALLVCEDDKTLAALQRQFWLTGRSGVSTLLTSTSLTRYGFWTSHTRQNTSRRSVRASAWMGRSWHQQIWHDCATRSNMMGRTACWKNCVS